MSNRAWMPLHIDDYLKDTGHLNALEHGAYLLMIMHYWRHGSLPSDERIIARIAKLTPEQWAESRDLLAMMFHDGWCHKRIDVELAKADDIIEKRRNAALERHSRSKPDASAVHVQSNSTDTGALPRTSEPSSSLRSDEKRATRLREGWELPVEWRQDAIEAGLPEGRIDLEARRMRDWSMGSEKGAKRNWRSTWRNWCSRVAEELAKARASPNGKPLTAAEMLKANREQGNFRNDGSTPTGPRLIAAR